jgi:hypothetical protein
MGEARAKGGVLLLVGDSCVGKTRLLYESARRELPDFAVLVPDLGDGDLINTVAQASFRLPKLIIWLDELQRFLPGPYLGEGATAVTPASIRRLLDAPTPVIVVGTLWPVYAQTLRSVTIDPDHPGERRPRYPGAVDILTDSRVHETRLDPFNSAERAAAAALAAQDPTLAAAVADRDYNVTEALAGARELIARYQRATSAQLAILHAAVDARRVGIESPLSADLLRAAALGYLPSPHTDDSWFSSALAELASHQRPQDRATAPLLSEPSPDRRSISGYWQAFAEHTHATADIVRLADNAKRRLRYDVAQAASCRVAEVDENSAVIWAQLLLGQDRFEEAIDVLRPGVVAGWEQASLEIVFALFNQGDTEQIVEIIQAQLDAGHAYLAWYLPKIIPADDSAEETIDALLALLDSEEEHVLTPLVELLADRGRIDEAIEVLRPFLAEHHEALDVVVELLIDHDRVEEWRGRADADDRAAALVYAHMLVDLDREDEAIDVLRPLADDPPTAEWLIRLLTKQHRDDEILDVLRSQADAGNEDAAKSLADRLTKRARNNADRAMTESMVDLFVLPGRIDELAAQAEASDVAAAMLLAEVRIAQGRAEEATTILRSQAGHGNQDAADELSRLETAWDEADARYAELRARAEAGDADAAEFLAWAKTYRDRADQMLERAAAGDREAAKEVAEPLSTRRLIAERQARVDAGDRDAIIELASVRGGENRLSEAIELMRPLTIGDPQTAQWFNQLLASESEFEELRARAQAGDKDARWHLVRHLEDQGRIDEAIDLLRVDTGDWTTTHHLAALLARHNRLDELRALADAGDHVAAGQLLDVLVQRGLENELLAEVNAGTFGAAERLIDQLGNAEEADMIRRFGFLEPKHATDYL